MDKIIRIGILDDHSATIDGYRFKLQDKENLQILWAVGFYSELEAVLEQNPVDVLILDASVPISPDNRNNYPILHAIPSILEQFPEIVILVISMHNRRAFINNIMRTGANGYIVKEDKEAYEKLPEIIQQAVGGEILFPQLAQTRPNGAPKLTPRMCEALEIKAGQPEMSTTELAERMKIKTSTLRNLLSDAYYRLGAKNAAGAIKKAKQFGLITPDQQI